MGSNLLFGTNHYKKILQSGLDTLHSKMEAEEITPEILTKEKALNREILKAPRQEEEFLIIKSRQLWLKGGDRNTNYFHKQTKIILSSNFINEL